MSRRAAVRSALALTLLTPALAAGAAGAVEPEVVAVFVGDNLGSPGDEPLRYAESDARRLRDVLVELGGVLSERALLVLGGGPADVDRALGLARAHLDAAARAGRPAAFYFLYSGHGDDEALHLPGGPLPITELRARMAALPARLRLIVLDACRTGGRSRGLGRGRPITVAVTPDSPEGTVELRASAAGEAAQESDELGGAVFSHYLVSGLRGAADADHDGRVTLDELYAHAWRSTLLRTGGAALLQHPEIAVRLAGSGEVVLSRITGRGAFVEVPPGAERHLVFGMPRGTVLGELGPEGGRLAVPAGRVLIVRRDGERAAVAEVDLSWGGARVLRAADFRAISREALAARGGALELHPYRVGVRAGVESLPSGAEPIGLVVAAELARSFGRLELEGDLGYGAAPVDSPAFRGWKHSAIAGLSLGLRGFAGRFTLVGSLGGEVRYARERLERLDADRVRAAGLPASEDHGWMAGGPRLALRAALPLGRRLSLALVLAVTGLVQQERASDGAVGMVVRPLLSAGLSFGEAF